MDASAHFAGKKITVMGLGLLGRGLGDVKYLASSGAELIVTDLKSKEQLATSLEELKDFGSITYVLGEHRIEDFRNRDFVLKAAGVPLDSPYITEAHKNGIPVKMSASLFLEIAGIRSIGVTGTRGKSTTTHMIKEILDRDGKKVLLGGNVRGVSTLALLKQVTGDEIVVLELDSWQLQGFGDARMSPNVAVFTTFFPDHLNYYKNDLDAYLNDKAQIFLHQKEGDTLVLGAQVAPLIQEKYTGRLKAKVVIASDKNVPEDWKLQIPGMHNRYNAALALAATHVVGAEGSAAKDALGSFKSVGGRLELVRTVDGVAYYNDTTATTPEATVAALKALDTGKKNVVLIMGGADKGLDMTQLWDEVLRSAKDLYFLAGTGTDRIRSEAPHVPIYASLQEAFDAARANVVPGDTVLFSPAFASFGMFKNEYDRGDQFNALVNAL